MRKVKLIDGRETLLQRFTSVLIPTNKMMMDGSSGAQDMLPYVGQLTALHLAPDEELFMESEDLQSAFNLFRVPPQWSPYFAYSRKVHGSAFWPTRSGKGATSPDGCSNGLEVSSNPGPKRRSGISSLTRDSVTQWRLKAVNPLKPMGGELNGNLGTIKVGRDSKTSRQSAWLCWPKPKSLNTR